MTSAFWMVWSFKIFSLYLLKVFIFWENGNTRIFWESLILSLCSLPSLFSLRDFPPRLPSLPSYSNLMVDKRRRQRRDLDAAFRRRKKGENMHKILKRSFMGVGFCAIQPYREDQDLNLIFTCYFSKSSIQCSNFKSKYNVQGVQWISVHFCICRHFFYLFSIVKR